MRRSYHAVGLLLSSYNAIISNYRGFSYSPKLLHMSIESHSPTTFRLEDRKFMRLLASVHQTCGLDFENPQERR